MLVEYITYNDAKIRRGQLSSWNGSSMYLVSGKYVFEGPTRQDRTNSFPMKNV